MALLAATRLGFLTWGLATFSGSVFGSGGRPASVPTTLLCCCSRKAARRYGDKWVWLCANMTADTGSDRGLPIAAPVVVEAPWGARPSFPGVTVFTCHIRPGLDATGVGKTQLPQRSHLSPFCSAASFSASFRPPSSCGFGVWRVTYWEVGAHVFRGSLRGLRCLVHLLAPSSARSLASIL